MADRDSILRYAADLLDLPSFNDYGPQGCQYLGTVDVQKIVGGVSISLNLIEAAHDADADMILVHHGLFWNNEIRLIDRRQKQRLRGLAEYNLTLGAYHLALDGHPDFGNNILAATNDLLLKNIVPFGGIGWGGDVRNEWVMWDILESTYPNAQIFGSNFGNIKKAAVIVGAAGSYFNQAMTEGYDLFFTGEPTEMAPALAQELEGIYVAAGHYNTERAGIKRLTQLCAQEFGIEWEFIDLANPV